VNVRHVQHRQIVITQAEKLRNGFFLKTKTQVSSSRFSLAENFMKIFREKNRK